MPRRGKVLRHKTPPDAKYNSVLVQTMINKVMTLIIFLRSPAIYLLLRELR